MTDADLQDKGVAALGARTKVSRVTTTVLSSLQLYNQSAPIRSWPVVIEAHTDNQFLKVFYNVRERFDIPHPAGSEQYAPGKDDK